MFIHIYIHQWLVHNWVSDMRLLTSTRNLIFTRTIIEFWCFLFLYVFDIPLIRIPYTFTSLPDSIDMYSTMGVSPQNHLKFVQVMRFKMTRSSLLPVFHPCHVVPEDVSLWSQAEAPCLWCIWSCSSLGYLGEAEAFGCPNLKAFKKWWISSIMGPGNWENGLLLKRHEFLLPF